MADRSIGARAAYLKRMTPPRKPRSESPKITIRLLRRQLGAAQATIADLQLGRADKEKVIAGYDVQLEETASELMRVQNMLAGQACHIGDLTAKLRQKSERLAYLEGYFYAKDQETVPTISPVRAASSLVASDPADTQA